MKLTVIGCGDAFGSGGRLNTCFYIKTEKTGLLIDCGATSLPGLKLRGIEVEHIDTIVLSHFHGDHYGGVPFLLLDAMSKGRKKRINIISPPGGKERISALLDLLYPGTVVLPKLDVAFIEYTSAEDLNVDGLSLMAYPVIHSEAALPHGLRIKLNDKIICYSGDTSWTDVLFPLSVDADLFICECNFYDTVVKGHMSYMELEPKLLQFNCRKILLTHFDTEMLQRLADLNVTCATDGLEISI
ncbi:MBL fold metallo-hydrolase [Pedobacter psychroterrae]|uniref:MBL fold metallo-hydrolase n=1 Tax=Pedobacter psychroterrae TaxID=2530453 RepID=A0A4V6N640_9SPHI|nr:MBL fold metallo-hydrolase [Pedobacter psychroterrae]TCD03777.1 MBL fold metallo-hydrolase [Pedobacter psychroterrae]